MIRVRFFEASTIRGLHFIGDFRCNDHPVSVAVQPVKQIFRQPWGRLNGSWSSLLLLGAERAGSPKNDYQRRHTQDDEKTPVHMPGTVSFVEWSKVAVTLRGCDRVLLEAARLQSILPVQAIRLHHAGRGKLFYINLTTDGNRSQGSRQQEIGLDLEHYSEVAEQAARRGGEILLGKAETFSVRERGPSDLVTSADLASQQAIRQTILAEFPEHTFLGEEGPEEPDPEAQYRWIVDPLDGTTNYVHRLEFFCVSIALELRGELVVGVIYDPNADRCFKATRGGGAVLNGQAIRVSQVSELRQALLVTGFPPAMHKRPDLLRLFADYSALCHSVRRLGSAALDLAYVAWGRLDGFYSTNLHSWDAAAGAVIVREAGGQISNLDGTAYDLYTPDILASNGLVHQAMVLVASRHPKGSKMTNAQ